jgi:hypothetical protein
VRSPASNNRNACSRNSAGYGGLVFGMDSLSGGNAPNGQVSTKPRQLHTKTIHALGATQTRIRAGRPQTNGHVENLHKTILDECWRPAFARYHMLKYTGLRRDLEHYLDTYNTDRAHTGRITQGRIPADIIDPARKMQTR